MQKDDDVHDGLLGAKRSPVGRALDALSGTTYGGIPGAAPGSPLAVFAMQALETRRKDEVVLVYVRYIAEVSTVDQCFKCAIGFDMRWEADPEDVAQWDADPAGFTPSFVPQFEFPNAKELAEERRRWSSGSEFKIVNVGGRTLCMMRTLVQGTFMATFDLHRFPFDCQALKVVCDMSFDGIGEAMFVPADEALDLGTRALRDGGLVTLNREFSAIAEFDFKRCLVEFANRSQKGSSFRWSQMVIRFQLERRWEGHVSRVAQLTLLLTLCALAGFAFDIVDALDDRLDYLNSIVLANTVFQLLVRDSIPPLPYMCWMDLYCMSMFVLSIALLFMNAIAGNWLDSSPPEDVRAFDENVLFPCAVAAAVLLNVGFAAWAVFGRLHETSKLSLGMEELRNLNVKRHETEPLCITGADMLPECVNNISRGDEDPFCSFASQ